MRKDGKERTSKAEAAGRACLVKEHNSSVWQWGELCTEAGSKRVKAAVGTARDKVWAA